MRRGCNSRAKGAAGEREAATLLNELFGWNSRRAQQFCGRNPDAADLIVEDTPDLYYEVKRVQRLAVPKTMEKAREDAGRKCPVLLHRQNRGGWLLTIFVEDLPRLVHAYESALTEDRGSKALAEKAVPSQDRDQNHGGQGTAGVPRDMPYLGREGAHQDQASATRLHVRSVARGIRSRGQRGVPDTQP